MTNVSMEAICSPQNIVAAVQAVVRNKGAPGVDGMTFRELPVVLAARWPEIERTLLEGRYQPQPVRRVMIPKPGDIGERALGIPTVLDRTIQQAVLQQIQPLWDPTFSEHSYGFRPGRSAHQAVVQAQAFVIEGHQFVVDLDLAKFFDASSDYPRIPGETAKRSPLASGTLIRKPFRRPWRIWTASSSPRFTRCKMVWRETPSCFVASIMGMKPGGVFSTKRLSRSSVMRISHGAPGVGCSAGMKPSSIQRSTVPDARLSTSAALRTVTGSPLGVSDGAVRQGMPR